jgi:hypothetical protein
MQRGFTAAYVSIGLDRGPLDTAQLDLKASDEQVKVALQEMVTAGVEQRRLISEGKYDDDARAGIDRRMATANLHFHDYQTHVNEAGLKRDGESSRLMRKLAAAMPGIVEVAVAGIVALRRELDIPSDEQEIKNILAKAMLEGSQIMNHLAEVMANPGDAMTD